MLRRYPIIILVILLSIITSCNNKKPEPFILPQGIQEVMQAVSMDRIHSWQGNINGTTPVIIWYKRRANTLRGSIVYTEKKEGPKPIVGIIKDSIYTVAELDNNIPKGILSFKVMGVSIEGTYKSYISDEQYNMSMIYTDTAVTIPPFDPADIKLQMANIH